MFVSGMATAVPSTLVVVHGGTKMVRPQAKATTRPTKDRIASDVVRIPVEITWTTHIAINTRQSLVSGW